MTKPTPYDDLNERIEEITDEARQRVQEQTPFKLYVWKGVLCDYTCGMIVVIAQSYEEAFKVATDDLSERQINEVKRSTPVVVDLSKVLHPMCWSVSGGG